MTVERTLAKAEDDLRNGDAAMARTRLRGLVGSMPQRLDLRALLAQAYRAEGNRAQAGRWSYLGEQPDPREVAAFERAYGDDPVRIMAALGWRGSEDDAATGLARQRLLDVRVRAEKVAGTKLDWSTRRRNPATSWRDDLSGLGCFAIGLVVVALAVVGAVTVVGWVF